MGIIWSGRLMTYHVFKGVQYFKTYTMRASGRSHGYDYYIPEGNGNFKYFNTFAKLKAYINALVEVEAAKKKLANLA